MFWSLSRLFFLIVLAFTLTACNNKSASKDQTAPEAPAAATENQSKSDTPAQSTQAEKPLPGNAHQAKVVKALQAFGPNTTYLELENNGKRFWIAAAKLKTKVGDTIQYSTDNAVKMENFNSKALGRSFEEILFIADAKVVKEAETQSD